eukprot:SAG25_NODE_9881_length_354_cov_0.811765_2_plen_44_part_01
MVTLPISASATATPPTALVTAETNTTESQPEVSARSECKGVIVR